MRTIGREPTSRSLFCITHRAQPTLEGPSSGISTMLARRAHTMWSAPRRFRRWSRSFRIRAVRQAGHNTFWKGNSGVNHFSIGIELSHKTGTPFPGKQFDAMLDLIDRIRTAYPTIPANGIVGHMDVLLENSSQILSGRDCPGFDFEWPLLEKRGLSLIPSGAAVNLDMYGGFFQVAASPKNMLVAGDSDASRKWGGVTWPVPAPPPGPGAPPPDKPAPP